MQSAYPLQCPWRLLTNTQCPGCGFQRAFHCLLHGEVGKALQYNYFFILSIPYAVMVVLATWFNQSHVFDKLHTFVFHRYTLKTYVVVYVAWWVIRNIYGI